MQERPRLHDDMHYIFMVCVNDIGRADNRTCANSISRTTDVHGVDLPLLPLVKTGRWGHG